MNGIREQLLVEATDDGVRVDRWIADALRDLDYPVSRAQVQEFIANGHVQSTKSRVKASGQVKAGEEYEISVPAAEPLILEADDIEIDVVYEDEHLIVVNKPRGLVVHPAAGHPRGTLVNALVYRGVQLSHLGGELRPGVVHRIDKDTSGLLVLAKSDLAYASLAAQLKEHTMERRYRAIVHGRIDHEEGTIEAPIGRDPKNRQRMGVTDNGKDSVTHFHVLERFPNHTYLELKLETGRTHQIRVHMTYIGYPLVGDPVYGHRHDDGFAGQALHAMTLGFNHPLGGERLRFDAVVPADILDFVDGLRTRLT
ncbi:MAG: pseudouridine synthase [Alicyclobacillus sp. RIFOXYA1_FULL_53_8]|nr:MAG: pseudouridine synthase [Alicyclobacillus sp. RIFOXYA1_FULL_53_8]